MISCIAGGCFTAEPVEKPTSTRASSKKGGRTGEHPHIWRKGERLWSQTLPTPSFSPGLCLCLPPLNLIPLPLCCPHAPPQTCLSPVPTAKSGGRSDFRPGPLTLAGRPRPSGAEASRAGTVEGAHCVVTAARSAGRWLLGTFIHVFFTRGAPEASRAHTAERARQVLTDPSATQARALDTFIYICSEQGTQVIPPLCPSPHTLFCLPDLHRSDLSPCTILPPCPNPWSLHLHHSASLSLIILPPSSAAAAAKSLQSCLTLCDPIDGSPPGSPVPGILQARTLEWVAISFSNA